MKIQVFLIILVLLSVFACDRFDHVFEEDNDELYVVDFFDVFATEIATISNSNLPQVMSYYTDDYNNNGQSKTDMEIYFQTLIDDGLSLTATLVDTTSIPEITWNLIGDDGTKEIVIDENISDVLVLDDDEYKFYGNQADMRNVMIELFTGQWCSNCPKAEEALHNLKLQYGNRVSYAEYHFNDELQPDFAFDLFSYYPNLGSIPFGIVNGNEHILTSAPSVEEVQSEIEAAIELLLQQDPLVLFSDLQAEINDDALSGSVMLQVDQSVALDDLKLIAVLMENYNDDYLNYHDEPHHKIVLKREVFDITQENCTSLFDFEINELNDLPAYYAGILPDDLVLVILVQRLTDPYNQNSCEVYNVVEMQL